MSSTHPGFTVWFSYSFPSPWPPRQKYEMFRQVENGSELYIEADEKGRIILRYKRDDKDISFISQPLLLYNFVELVNGLFINRKSSVFMIIRYHDDDGFMINVSGNKIRVDLLSDEDADGQALSLKEMASDSIKLAPLYQSIVTNDNMSWDDILFLQEVKELEERLLKNTEYDLIKASGVLRKLLVEGGAVAPQIARKHSIALRFTKDGIPWSKFKKGNCLMAEQRNITVEQLILAYANSRGGVHLGEPDKPEQVALKGADAAVKLSGLSYGLEVFSKICHLVLEGLKPLVEAVLHSYSKPTS
jgi:hypothetical protein